MDDPDLQREQSFSLGKTLNCNATDTSDLIECLRSVSASELHEAYVKVSGFPHNVNAPSHYNI